MKKLLLLITLISTGVIINAQNITNYFPSDGLNEGGIYAIEEDQYNDLWEARLERDYPGWEVIEDSVKLRESGENYAEIHTYYLRPPNRDFSLGIQYLSENGAEPTSKDNVLRQNGLYGEAGATSLLDFIHQHYVLKGTSITNVYTTPNGEVSLIWDPTTSHVPLSIDRAPADMVTYEAESDFWSATPATSDE